MTGINVRSLCPVCEGPMGETVYKCWPCWNDEATISQASATGLEDASVSFYNEDQLQRLVAQGCAAAEAELLLRWSRAAPGGEP